MSRCLNNIKKQSNGPNKDDHILISGTYGYVILHGKREFADVTFRVRDPNVGR